MSTPEHEAEAEFPYRREDVFKAIVVGVDNLPGMRVEDQDAASGRILVEMGMGGGSGQRIPLSVEQVEPGRTRVSMTAAYRRQPPLDPERSRAVMDRIVDATSEALKVLARD